MSAQLMEYKRVMECENCGQIGHVKAFCWDISMESQTSLVEKMAMRYIMD
jgi:hypothetical protein